MGVLTKTTKEGKRNRRWVFAGYVRKGVFSALVLSLLIFAVYLVGSIPDPGFSDRQLFLLLRLLRYSSLLLCAFSLFAMGFSVHRLVLFPKLRNFLGLGFFFIIGLLGAILAMLDSFMVAAAVGNV